MPHRETFETVNGCKIRIMRGGQGAPLLYLHGALGVAAWMPFMERLSQRFDVIVPDHPGFGASDTPDWLDNIGDLAYFYLDFDRSSSASTGVHLVGASLGGWIAAEIAVRDCHPLQVADADRAGRHPREGPEQGRHLHVVARAVPAQSRARSEGRRGDAGAAGLGSSSSSPT